MWYFSYAVSQDKFDGFEGSMSDYKSVSWYFYLYREKFCQSSGGSIITLCIMDILAILSLFYTWNKEVIPFSYLFFSFVHYPLEAVNGTTSCINFPCFILVYALEMVLFSDFLFKKFIVLYRKATKFVGWLHCIYLWWYILVFQTNFFFSSFIDFI